MLRVGLCRERSSRRTDEPGCSLGLTLMDIPAKLMYMVSVPLNDDDYVQ